MSFGPELVPGQTRILHCDHLSELSHEVGARTTSTVQSHCRHAPMKPGRAGFADEHGLPGSLLDRLLPTHAFRARVDCFGHLGLLLGRGRPLPGSDHEVCLPAENLRGDTTGHAPTVTGALRSSLIAGTTGSGRPSVRRMMPGAQTTAVTVSAAKPSCILSAWDRQEPVPVKPRRHGARPPMSEGGDG